MRILCWITKATYTLKICNNYCFSTTQMVTLKRLSVALVRTLPLVFLLLLFLYLLRLTTLMDFPYLANCRFTLYFTETQLVSPLSTCLLGYSTLMLPTTVIYLTHFLLTLVTYHFPDSEHCKTRYLLLSVLVIGILFIDILPSTVRNSYYHFALQQDFIFHNILCVYFYPLN
jgi:hypothetical protein